MRFDIGKSNEKEQEWYGNRLRDIDEGHGGISKDCNSGRTKESIFLSAAETADNGKQDKQQVEDQTGKTNRYQIVKIFIMCACVIRTEAGHFRLKILIEQECCRIRAGSEENGQKWRSCENL